jgi:hypothetical protein
VTVTVTVTDSEPASDRLSLVTQSRCPSPGPLAAVAGSLTGAPGHWHLQAGAPGSRCHVSRGLSEVPARRGEVASEVRVMESPAFTVTAGDS